jgi:type IV pilus assembly protein PilY1
MTKNRLPGRICRWLIVCAFAPAAYATQTDLATAPLITSAPQVVKPNLLFILDDSGSMAWSHMPDTAENFISYRGYKSSQCNGLYYNPGITYSPPKTDSGVNYPDSSFTAAWVNGYRTSDGVVNLNTSFQAYTNATLNGSSNDTAQQGYYYTYSGTLTNDAQKDYFATGGPFYLECNSNSTLFTKVQVNGTSGPPGRVDERTNFANWYSYYRTRILAMKTAAGHAFQTIGDQYRVGYMSINNNVSPSFLNVATFDAAQKTSWYSKLYGATPNNSTPLREALSNAGRMYAGKLTSLYGTTVTDPIQYSCQKNFTVLSTDGYWNGSSGFQLDGSTAVGNQDSGEPRPFNDGGTVADVYQATITVSGGSSSTSVTGIKVNGFQILSGATSASSTSSTVAQRIATKINDCTSGVTGSCTVAGYRAVLNGSVVTITAPASLGAINYTPVVTKSGSKTVAAVAFAGATVSTGGTSETLADVAEYYYKTDLRTTALGNQSGVLGTDISANEVLPGGEDIATWQHMTTFTLGLGARGRMIYSANYKTATSGDFYDVANGSTASSSVCKWQTAGTVCNWPTPASDQPENIDDLWHAAVNGRGTYFSATDPATLSVGLLGALQAINAVTSDTAAATTSNPNVTAGDNFVFSSTFRSAEWYGDFERRQVDVSTGELSDTADWQARPQLDARAYTSRAIYTRDSGASNGLRAFLWANLTGAEQAYFSTPYISTGASPTLSQFCVSGDICLSATNQTAASGQPLLNYIRGDRTNEGAASDISKYFRLRTSVLGDIVDAEAVYVKAPMFDYVDSGYSAYKTANASRQGMAYVGANDGMLHAFNAGDSASGGGSEVWAYVPQALLPNLYKLADKYYATKHQYYVDGSPTQADVFFGGAWHTILVGGYNAGGRGYYALDVTDPASPKALWEVSNTTTGFANMGNSYGRPEITKLKDGTWVVLLTSGYNNVSPGNGQGYLYVVNAGSGALIRSIGTGVGSDTGTVAGVCATAPCPSGLAQIRAWVDNTRYDNTAQRVYGGDIFGNVWRFDINGDVGASGYDAQLLATLRGSSGNVQSVTARPELADVAGFAVVYVGTGRYLGATDLSDSSGQSIYAIKDNLGSTSLGNPRGTGTTFVQQTLTDATCPTTATYCTPGIAIRTGTSLGVNFAVNDGWFVDLPGTRERANTDPQLALGTLAVTTNLLNPSACTVGGTSFVNFFDYRTGGAVSTASGMVSVSLGQALATRPVLLRIAGTPANGSTPATPATVRSLIRMSDNTWQTPMAPFSSSSGARRTSWRELVTE